MSILAQFQDLPEAGERRSTPRQRLRLKAEGAGALDSHLQAVVHDLSRTGLLIETASPLPLEGTFEVELPEAGTVEARVIWNSSHFFGCRFGKPISKAALSAALLQSDASDFSKNEVLASVSDSLVELKELSARVRQASVALDCIIEELRRPLLRIGAEKQVRSRSTLEVQEEDERTSFAKGLAVAIVLAAAAWALILWALGVF